MKMEWRLMETIRVEKEGVVTKGSIPIGYFGCSNDDSPSESKENAMKAKEKYRPDCYFEGVEVQNGI